MTAESQLIRTVLFSVCLLVWVQGGGNTPFVLIDNSDAVGGGTRPVCVIASTCLNAEITDGIISPTLLCRAGTGGNQLPIVTLKRT